MKKTKRSGKTPDIPAERAQYAKVMHASQSGRAQHLSQDGRVDTHVAGKKKPTV